MGLWPVLGLPKRSREGLYVGWLFLVALSLGATAIEREMAVPLPSIFSFLPEGPSLLWDAPARWMAAFLMGTNAFMTAVPLLAGQAPSRGSLEAAMLLVLYGASLAALSAGNLLMLCLAWGVGEMATAAIHAVRTQAEERRYTLWSAWGGVASLFLLIGAMSLLTASQGRTAWADVSTSPWALRMLLVSAVLKMAIPSLSGRFLEHAETCFPSLAMGALLWGRLFTVSSQPLPLEGPWGAIGAGILLTTGLVAALTPDFSKAFAYIASNRLAMALLASLLGLAEGPAIAWMTILTLIMAAALLRAGEALSQSRGHWGPLGRAWALLGLLGVPLTPGFLAHWAFLRGAWLGGFQPLAFWGSLSLLLTAVPMWRQLAVPFDFSRVSRGPGGWTQWAAVGGLAVLSAWSLALGTAPHLAWSVWGGGMSLSSPWEGSSELLGTLTYIALLGPFLGGYGLGRVLEGLPGLWECALRVLRGILVLDWLVYSTEEALIRLQAFADEVLAAIERRFYLAWTLIWGIAMILLYVERLQ
ncbi:MAG: hypothetical protein H5T66_02230 [Chloroflexi bacterium]|nr:hypothetical protein [Chloroflexota bacterium]